MKTNAPFYGLTKSQRRGIIWTLFLFLVIHLGIYLFPKGTQLQEYGLVLDSLAQQKVDSMIADIKQISKDTIYPFNPNYISDFKAYQLNIPMDAVRRIRTYRAKGKYMNSISRFAEITQLHDSQLNRIRPYLKLPDIATSPPQKKVVLIKKELNDATAEELTHIYGIGDVIAQRIVTVRNQLGGFLVQDQLNDIWGLDAETQKRIWEKFKLDSVPVIKKRNINRLTIAQLSENYYISPSLASRIVAIRTQRETLTSWDDLKTIHALDSVRKTRLSLYLFFK